MYLLTVAPISRGIPVNELTYLTKHAPAEGAVILVPVRKKILPAIVLSIKDAREEKASIKSADFELKTLASIDVVGSFPKSFISAITTTAHWHVSSLGATIQALFPNTLLETGLPGPKDEGGEEQSERTVMLPFILQAEESERMATYKSHIREVFAKGGSVFFILPTIQDIERIDTAIGKGIGTYTYVLHGNLTAKQISQRVEEIATSDHSVLVIATPQFVATPCKNLKSIILERESASSYTMTHRPYIDARFFVESYAKEARLTLILGDLFLRAETMARYEKGELDAFVRPKARYSSTAIDHLVDMRSSGEQPAVGKIAFFSKELVSLITDTRKRGASTFILCIRRGTSPITVCGDCGTVVTCELCTSPLVLHKTTKTTVKKTIQPEAKEQKNTIQSPEESASMCETVFDSEDDTISQESLPTHTFLCHRCGNKTEPKHTCAHCGGWRFTPLGLGIEQAEQTLKARWKDATIFRIDVDSIKSHKEAKERVQQFFNTPGAILLGTEMAIPYLTDTVGLIGILSVNSLLTIPEYRMNEHVFRLLLVLREKARDHFLIQTRDMHDMFPQILKGNIGEFLGQELSLRKELGFPPFALFIKVSLEGQKRDCLDFLSYMQHELATFQIPNVSYPPLSTRKPNITKATVLISTQRHAWPNNELRDFLMTLPPTIDIKVEPKSTLND